MIASPNQPSPYAKNIVFIEATWGSEVYKGAGFLIGRNDVVTAANLVYNAALGRAADDVKVLSAVDFLNSTNTFHRPVTVDFYNPSKVGLYENTPVKPPNSTYFGPNMNSAEADIALLSLGTAIGDTLGWFGIEPAFDKGGNVAIHGLSTQGKSELIQDDGTITASRISDVYTNAGDIQVLPGMIGSPIIYEAPDGPKVVGLAASSTTFTDIGLHLKWLESATAANDRLLPGYSGHYLYGTVINNVYGISEGVDFRTSIGNDKIFGGDGIDTVKYHLPRGSYSVNKSLHNPYEVSVTLPYTEKHYDQLYKIDRLSFSDGILAYDVDGPAGKTYRLYQAAFDRKPDNDGLKHNIALVDSGMTLKQMASAFINSAEFIGRYGASSSNTNFVTNLYQNILGRAPEAAGLNGWLNQLSSGAMDRADVLVGFSESIENKNVVDWQIWNGIWLT